MFFGQKVRTSQSVSVTAPTVTTATERTFLAPTDGQRPVQTLFSPIPATTIVIAANPAPPALTRRLVKISPRMKWLHDVVIPQAGQRIPSKKRIEQGGSPSC